MENEKKFVFGRDGFIEYERPMTLSDAAVVWDRTIKNRWLYEYDCSVYELDENNLIKRRVSYEELKGLTT